MLVCVLVKLRCVCKWSLKLGRVDVGRFMVRWKLIIGKRRGVRISPVVMCKT